MHGSEKKSLGSFLNWRRIFTRQRIIELFILTFFLLLTPLVAQVGLPGQISAAPENPFCMTILHTNDLHAHDQPFLENSKSVGGFARIAYLIDQIRQHAKNVVVVDAGDIFQGTPFYRIYRGRIEVELLNKAGYNIYTIGNHEFDDGPANLAKQLSLAHFDILSANLDATAAPALARLVKPAVIKNIGVQKVGFIGAITPELLRICLTTGGVHPYGASAANSTDTVPVDWYKPIADEALRLNKIGINKIVVVSHCGVDLDRQLALEVPGIDVIVGGHSHTQLSKPIIVPHDDGTATYIVQTGCYGRALGKFRVSFDPRGNVIGAQTNYKLIPITSKIPEDPAVAAFIGKNAKPVDALRNITLGCAQSLFDNKFREYRNDSALGDLVCDAIAESGAGYGATIALQNRGGIRGPIRPGAINAAEIEEMLPFENTIVYATISGASLLRSLEHAVERKSGGQFLDVHGLKFGYDANKPPGSRITFALAQHESGAGKSGADKIGTYQPIDANAQYKVAMNSYTFSGGERYSFPGATHVVDSKLRTAEVLEQYLKRHHQVTPHVDGRITAVPLVR